MITAFIATLFVLVAVMLALSISPVFRKRKPQCSCKTARRIMAATDPRRKPRVSDDPRNSPFLPIISDEQNNADKC